MRYLSASRGRHFFTKYIHHIDMRFVCHSEGSISRSADRTRNSCHESEGSSVYPLDYAPLESERGLYPRRGDYADMSTLNLNSLSYNPEEGNGYGLDYTLLFAFCLSLHMTSG